MNEICKNLIESFCSEKMGMHLDSAELEFLQNFDWSPFPVIYQDDSDYHVVDGEEGDWGFRRYYTDSTKKVLLAEFKNEGGDTERWEFKPLFVTCISPIIMQMFGERLRERLRHLATHDENTSITRTPDDDDNSITRTTQ